MMRCEGPQWADMRLLLLMFWVPLAAEGSLLGAIHSVLSYYVSRQLDDNFLFGVLLAKGQLNAIKSVNRYMEGDVDILLSICDKIMDNNPRLYINKDTERRIGASLTLLKMSEPIQLKRPDNLTYSLETNLRYGSPSSYNSTLCLFEAMMAERVSDLCLMQVTDPKARGYTLCHQALYYSIAASTLPFPLVQDSILQRCQQMLSEVNYAWENGMPEILRDVAIEEVTVCGMSKYREFLTKPILDFILSLQHEDGCFSVAKEGPLNKCENHFSSVSMVALTTFLYNRAENQLKNLWYQQTLNDDK